MTAKLSLDYRHGYYANKEFRSLLLQTKSGSLPKP